MNTSSVDRPRVVAIPPLIYLLFAAAGGVAEFFAPTDTLPTTVQIPVGLALAAVSFVLVRASMRKFRDADTPFNVRKAATAMVTGGPFRFSRNPGYLALTLLYVAIAVVADSLWMLSLLAPVLAIMHFGVIIPEERHLESTFGDDYLDYKRRVRRWI